MCKLKEMKFISEDEFTWFTRNSYIINTHGSRFAVRTAVCHAPTMTVNASLFPENGKQGLEDELEVFF